jgi:transcriptional regulator with XRE-family HTH domain
MVNSTEFGKRLQKIINFYGLSATAFSETIDFNRSTISHLLSGRNKPSLEFVMKVLHKFPEVELYWLLNGTGDFPVEKKGITSTTLPLIEGENQGVFLKQVEKLSKTSSEPSVKDSSTPSSNIERIIIFFEDGSFKAYKN